MPYINFTDEQKLRAANVDLEQFLIRQGEELVYRHREIRPKANHSVSIRGNEWYDFATRKPDQRQRLIDSFVNAVYVYDDRIVLTFNYRDGTETITLQDIEGSDLGGSPPPKSPVTTTVTGLFLFAGWRRLVYIILRWQR